VNPCNYAWNIESLALSKIIEIGYIKSQSKYEKFLSIVNKIDITKYLCEEVKFSISHFPEELIFKALNFYICDKNITHCIANIIFNRYSGKFEFWFYFKEV